MAIVRSLMPYDKLPFALVIKGDRNGTAFCRAVAYSQANSNFINAAEPTTVFPGASDWPYFPNFTRITEWRIANMANNVGTGDGQASFTQAVGTVRDVVRPPPTVNYNSGAGYPGSRIPIVFTGGGGTGAAGYAVVDQSDSERINGQLYYDNGLLDFVITNPGSGYTSNPTVTAANPNLNQIYKIRVNSGGQNYPATTDIKLTGGNGTGATARPVIHGGVITSVVITNPGSGYTSTPSVTLTNKGTGTGASLTVFRATSATPISAILSRSLASVAIYNPGSGYTDTPEVRVSHENTITGHTGGKDAAISATITAGVITALTLDAAGSGYPTLGSVISISQGVTIHGGKFNTSVVPEATNNSVTTTFKFRRLGAAIPMIVRWDIRNKVTNAVISTHSLTITAADGTNYSANYTITGIVGAAYIMTNFRIEVPI